MRKPVPDGSTGADPRRKDFVTGADGCLGRHVVKALLARNRHIVCAVREPETVGKDPLFQSPRISLAPLDLSLARWPAPTMDHLLSCENVFHLAAEMPHTPTCRGRKEILWKVNVEATQKLYEVSKGARRFLFVSSQAVYGEFSESPRDEYEPVEPSYEYARTKLAAERFLRTRSAAGRPVPVIVRPGILYGENDTNVLRRMTELIEKGWFRIIGDGSNVRGLSAAPLVAEVLARLAESPSPPPLLNVVDPRSPTVRELAHDIAALLRVPPPPRIPVWAAYPPAAVFSALNFLGFYNRFKMVDVRRMTTSNPVRTDRLRSFMGTVPDLYREALSADVAWYLRTKAVLRARARATASFSGRKTGD